jgi:transcriptional regulator with XRE-family HTH domain
MANHDEERAISLGESIRSLRIQRRFTQSELAEHANVSLGALKNLEKGRASIATLVRVIHALGHDAWLESLAPASNSFNPLDLIGQRRPAPSRAPQRVRHSKIES